VFPAWKCRLETLVFTEGSAAHNTLYWYIIKVQCSICISWSWQSASFRYFESFPDKMIWNFQIQSKNYIEKIMQIRKTISYLNSISCHCYQLKFMWRRDYVTYSVEFVAALWVNLAEWRIAIAIMLRIVGSTLSLVGSWRRSIVAIGVRVCIFWGCKKFFCPNLSLFFLNNV